MPSFFGSLLSGQQQFFNKTSPSASASLAPRQFLGFSFPTVRQATAQALYIRLLEEGDALELEDGEARVVMGINRSMGFLWVPFVAYQP